MWRVLTVVETDPYSGATAIWEKRPHIELGLILKTMGESRDS